MAATVPTSPLSEVLRLVGAVMGAIGDATPVMVGEQYLERGIGAGPRVVFVPEKRGTWGPPPQLNAGLVAGVTHGCALYVRGAESGDDATRFAAAEVLADLAVNILRALAPGRIVGGEWGDDSPAPVDAFGADLALTFTYTRGVAHNVTMAAAVATAIAARSPADPDRPNGDAGTTVSTALAAVPTR